MKGLLLKDFYMVKKYSRIYLLMTAVFLVISCLGSRNVFFAFYPVILCGMIPMNLCAYDEQSGWLQYSGTLLYTKAQIVSSKYLTGLISQLGITAIVTAFYVIQTGARGRLRIGELGVLLLIALIISLLIPSVTLPFAFKLGTEKGRLFFGFMFGLLCSAGVIITMIIQVAPHSVAGMGPVLALCSIGVSFPCPMLKS